MNSPVLKIAGLSFYETPSEVEGSPYWVDLWADVNGYKIGLQIKPSTYHSANASIYMGKAKSSEESGHSKFGHDFGGKVFIITPDGGVSSKVEGQIADYRDILLSLPPR